MYAICVYGIAMCDEWKRRGYVDNTKPVFEAFLERFTDNGLPEWLGDEDFHVAHRSNLLRKGKEWLLKKGDDSVLKRYRSLWPNIPDDLPYIWPVSKAGTLVLTGK